MDDKLSLIMTEAKAAIDGRPTAAQDPDAPTIDQYDSGFAAGMMRAAIIAFGEAAVTSIQASWVKAPEASS